MMKKTGFLFVLIFLAASLTSCSVASSIKHKITGTSPTTQKKAKANKTPQAQLAQGGQTLQPYPAPSISGTAGSPEAGATVQPAAGSSPASAGGSGLEITGKVNTPKTWTGDQIRAMKTMNVEAKNNKGANAKYMGVPINTLLDQAGLQPDAQTIEFIGSDGSHAQISVTDLKACQNCIIAFRKAGDFINILPGMPTTDEVRGVDQIQVH